MTAPLRPAALVLCGVLVAGAARAQEMPETFKPGDSEITALSAAAQKLPAGATRGEVAAVLGPADWVVLPTEKSPWGLYPKAVLLMLYWRNGPCTAVAAAFGPDDKLRHLDAGRLACVRSGAFPVVPDDSLTCAQEYRAGLCR
ncbi:MAG: hypothetical protein AB7U38_05110 [Hyphomicrobiales bacterium]